MGPLSSDFSRAVWKLQSTPDRQTRITDLQTSVGRTLDELLSCAKYDRLGLASIEQQPIDKEPAHEQRLLMTVPQCRAGYRRHTDDS